MGADIVPWTFLVAGFILLAAPLFWDWSRGSFASGTQGHELVIVAVAVWLGWRKREALAALPASPQHYLGSGLFACGLALYYFGRAYDVRLALLSLVLLVIGLLVYFRGWRTLGPAWFALFFPIFAAPLPLEFVMAVTGPLKMAVSAVAVDALRLLGYDVGRSGVVVTIGQYQLLVTEACAGLQTMFTLEAMGLLYASLVNHKAVLRNALLVIAVIPIAFAANVLRVIALALVTYYFGDAAGQGFLHEFAGLTLFSIALALVILTDWALGRLPGLRSAYR